MIGKRKFAMLTAGVALAAGSAAGVLGLVSGTAHAQGASSVSIVGMTENPQGTEAEVQLSFTCSAPGLFAVDVTAIQGITATGNAGYVTCTGSPQTENIVVEPNSSTGPFYFGTGQVQVGVTGEYDDQSVSPHTYNWIGATTTVSYTAATTPYP
jgi:hypothetical protein